MKKQTTQIARIDNQLVMKAHYNLSANEQKLILFLVSRITNPEDDDFNIQDISIKEIESLFVTKGTKRGSIYSRINEMCENIFSKKIKIPIGFEIKGKLVTMNELLAWFSHIKPYKDEKGQVRIRFQFSEPLKDFLLKLSEYVRINLVEIMPMRGKYSIRMYQIFKAGIEKNRKYRSRIELEYDLEELRDILGIEKNQYKRIQHFKERVLLPVKLEINKYSNEIRVDYELVKESRVVTGIKFLVSSIDKLELKPQNGGFIPSDKDLEKLTRSQLFAYQYLVERKCISGIAYKQIIIKMPSSEYFGWEDVFIEKAWNRFEKVTKHKDPNHKAGAFVKWWTNGEFKDKLFPELMEEVVGEKKRKKQVELDNREWAKGMTNKAFLDFLKSNKD